MRVCVISTPIFKLPLTGYGGLEAIAWETARGLAVRGHEVALVAPDGSECPGVQIIPCGPAGQVDEKMAYSGFPEAKDQQGNVLRRQHAGYWSALLSFDVVIDSSWMKWAYELKAEGILKAPVLGVFHAPVNTMYQMWPPNFPLKPVVEKACPVCISHDQAEHFHSIHNRPARVAYNGVDVDNFYVPIPGVKRTDRFLFLARFSTVKSPHLAIEACLKAGVGLDLVGDTSITNEPQYFEHCMQMARQQSPGWDASKGQQIVVHGGCTRGETVIWYNKAHALIHPTQNFREPFGLAPVEAAACFPADTLVRAVDIQRTYSLTYDGMLLHLTTDHGMIECTPEHPFMTQRGWVAAKDLTLADSLVRIRHERSEVVGERIEDLVQRLPADGSSHGSRVFEQISGFGEVQGEETRVVTEREEAVHQGRGENHQGSISGRWIGGGREDAETNSSGCSQEGSVHGGSVQPRSTGFHRGRTKNDSGLLSVRGGESRIATAEQDARIGEGKSAFTGAEKNPRTDNHTATNRNDNSGIVLSGGNHRRGRFGDAVENEGATDPRAGHSHQQHVEADDRLDHAEDTSPQRQGGSATRNTGARICERQATECVGRVDKGVQVPVAVSATSAPSDNQKTADGTAVGMVFASTVPRQTVNAVVPISDDTTDVSLYEFARLRSISGREVKNLPVFNLGTRSGDYEAAGYLVHNCGCPVIAWNYGAVKETVVHGDTGLLVHSMDELVWAIQMEWMRNFPSESRLDCREHAKRFSLEKMVDGYEKLIHEAVTTGGW